MIWLRCYGLAKNCGLSDVLEIIVPILQNPPATDSTVCSRYRRSWERPDDRLLLLVTGCCHWILAAAAAAGDRLLPLVTGCFCWWPAVADRLAGVHSAALVIFVQKRCFISISFPTCGCEKYGIKSNLSIACWNRNGLNGSWATKQTLRTLISFKGGLHLQSVLMEWSTWNLYVNT